MDIKYQKGQIYSLISVLIVIPLLLFIIVYINSLEDMNVGVVDKIVSDQVRQSQKIIESDFERALEISGKRALLSALNRVLTNGTFIPTGETPNRIKELMNNGSFDGEFDLLLFNNTIVNWKDRILGVGIGFNKYLNSSNLTIYNYNGLNIVATINFYSNVSDKTNKSRIERNTSKAILISTEGFDDPIFAVNGSGVVRKVKAHPYPYHVMKLVSGTLRNENCTGNITTDSSDESADNILVTTDASAIVGNFGGIIGETNDLPVGIDCYVVGATNAIDIINNTVNSTNYKTVYLDQYTGVWSLPIEEALEQGYYTTFDGTTGPSFLERLEGSTSSSTNGLETFVNIPDLQAVGYPTNTKPDQISVSYLYFEDASNDGCLQFRGLPDWFRLNAAFASKYNLTDIGYTVC
ncbi:MAG: hypothetical protein ABIJ92_04015 [Candidatus Aenigmatarchaeota archaeon]